MRHHGLSSTGRIAINHKRQWGVPDLGDVRVWAPIGNLGLANDAQPSSIPNQAQNIAGAATPVGALAKGGGTGATSAPLYKSAVAAFNNQPMLYWGAGNTADLETSGTFTTIAQPLTYWFVLQSDDNSALHVILENHSGTARNAIYYNTSTRVQIFAGSALVTATVDISVPTILSVEFNGASSKIFTQGVERASGQPGTQGPNGFVIGKDQDGSTSNWRGYLLPPIVMKGIPSASMRARMDKMLSIKYGIALS